MDPAVVRRITFVANRGFQRKVLPLPGYGCGLKSLWVFVIFIGVGWTDRVPATEIAYELLGDSQLLRNGVTTNVVGTFELDLHSNDYISGQITRVIWTADPQEAAITITGSGWISGNKDSLCANLDLLIEGKEMHFADADFGCSSSAWDFPYLHLYPFSQIGGLTTLRIAASPVDDDLSRFFLRGDGDGDGVRDITDAVLVLSYLFLGQAEPDCLDAADTNDDGQVDVTDAVALLEHEFLAGPAPAPPSVLCGLDRTDDLLGCNGQPACMQTGG